MDLIKITLISKTSIVRVNRIYRKNPDSTEDHDKILVSSMEGTWKSLLCENQNKQVKFRSSKVLRITNPLSGYH